MGPSTTSHTALGLYTSKDLPYTPSSSSDNLGKHLAGGPPELAIQFMMQYNSNQSKLEGSVLEELIWIPFITGGQFESPYEDSMVTFLPGIGMMGAFSSLLVNAQWDTSGIWHRSYRPGEESAGPTRGSFTKYHNVSARVTRNVFAGEELFIDFGNEWVELELEDSEDSKPQDEIEDQNEKASSNLSQLDYKWADVKLKSIKEYFDKHDREFHQNSHLKQSVWEYILSTILDRRARKIFPKSVEPLEELHQYGSLVYSHKDSTIRSMEWLNINARCVDRMKSQFPSTISNAGWGAFTTQSISKEKIITTTPLAPIWDKELFQMPTNFPSNQQSHQLLLNYCYTHPQSSVHLFPYGNVVNYINHSSNKANAKLVWAHDFPLFQPEFLNQPIDNLKEYLKHHQDPVLFMDIVALRDLEEGEEILIDYGDDWEKAWNAHVQNWESNSLSMLEKSVSHHDLNQKIRNNSTQYYKTVTEQREDPYPSNLHTASFVSEHLMVFEIEKAKVTWSLLGDDYEGDVLRLCDIINRTYIPESSQYEYMIQTKNVQNKTLIVDKVPSNAVTLVEIQSDVYHKGSFRQPIGLEEPDFFPDAWKDMK